MEIPGDGQARVKSELAFQVSTGLHLICSHRRPYVPMTVMLASRVVRYGQDKNSVGKGGVPILV